MITPAFIFTIFMLTLGPIKTVPAFFAMTQGQAPEATRTLALKGALTATAVCLLIAVVMTGVAGSWRISLDDLRIAGGILLFIASYQVISQFNRPAPPPAEPGKHPFVTPLAIPIIVTPWGVTAILIFIELADRDTAMLAIAFGILLLVMLLNLIGMLFAKQIIGLVGMITFKVVGWVFAVMQAGLAVDAVVTSLYNLNAFHSGA